MTRPPRPPREQILTRPRLLRILLGSTVMAAGTLAVLVWAPGPEAQLGVPTVAGTMAFVTFVFFQAFNLLNVRNDIRSVFSRETLENISAFVATGAVVVLLVLVVEMDILHGFFTTTDLTSGQWLVCAAIGSAILWTGELLKIVLGARVRRGSVGSPRGDRRLRPVHGSDEGQAQHPRDDRKAVAGSERSCCLRNAVHFGTQGLVNRNLPGAH